MHILIQDLRYGVRMLMTKPGFTIVAVLSLALGIGANTAIFSLLDAVLLRALPVQQPDQLVLFGSGEDVGITNGFPNKSWNLYSYPFYRDIRHRNQSFTDVAAVHSMINRVHGLVNTGGAASESEQIGAQLVSGSYFSVLGVKALQGRTLMDSDDQTPGGHPVAVVSYRWWQRRFGLDPSTIGKTITIGETTYTIIGITPKDFFGTSVGESPDLWVPLSMEAQLPPGWKGLDDKFFQSLYLLGRLKTGVTIQQAGTEINTLFKQIYLDYAGPQPTAEQQQDLKLARVDLTPAGNGLSQLRREFSFPLQILMGVVGIVLLIACANIANLLLARSTARQKEFAVRIALGAGRGRLIRQLLTESLLLAISGGLLGVLFAVWGSQALVAMASSGSETIPLQVSPDQRILVFTGFLSIICAVIFGLVPALRAAKTEINSSLKGDKGAISTAMRSPFGKGLLISQVALSLLLLIGAGLFVRTLINLQKIDTGYDLQKVLVFEVDTSSIGFKEDAALSALFREIEEKIAIVPGVQAASFSMFTFNQGAWSSRAFTHQQNSNGEKPKSIFNNVVGPNYFTAVGLPLLMGRVFNEHDTENAQKVAIINETMARTYFPGVSPIGQRFGLGAPENSEKTEVIGVVKDAKYMTLQEQPRGMAYYPHRQDFGFLNNLIVRVNASPDVVIPQIRRAIKEVNRQLPINEIVTFSDQVEESLVQQKLIARLSACFGLLAVLLSSVGLYGVMSYAVARRTNEIGIRMALGAQRSNVIWLVLKESLWLVSIGIVIGVILAAFTTKLAANLLFGLSPYDPLTIIIAAFGLIGVASVAGYLPARRASRVDPLTALRED